MLNKTGSGGHHASLSSGPNSHSSGQHQPGVSYGIDPPSSGDADKQAPKELLPLTVSPRVHARQRGSPFRRVPYESARLVTKIKGAAAWSVLFKNEKWLLLHSFIYLN